MDGTVGESSNDNDGGSPVVPDVDEDSGISVTELTEGMTYTTASGDTLIAGDVMPAASVGDVFIFGDYKYTCIAKECFNNATQSIIEDTGWQVETNDKTQSEYGVILTTINDFNVIDLTGTFFNCTSLTTAPEIPSGVIDMSGTFSNCQVLTTLPKIPNSVITMQSTFTNCTSLTDISNLVIPSSVKDMFYLFQNCTSLKGNIEINANPEEFSGCFSGTIDSIVITGSCSNETKYMLSYTADNGNVTY